MLYLPSDEAVSRGVHKFAREQWINVWLQSQRARNITAGPTPVPGKEHPDAEKAWETLPQAQRDWVLLLAYSRIVMLRNLGAEKVEELIGIGRGDTTLSDSTLNGLAKDMHDHWVLLRKGLGLSGHAGDKPWDDESEPEKDNDRKLVVPLCELLAELQSTEDEDLKALFAFITQG